MTEETRFRIDARVGLAVLVTLGLQTAAGLVWAGAAAERLAAVERATSDARAAAERLARLEARVDEARDSLARIEARLDHRTPQP